MSEGGYLVLEHAAFVLRVLKPPFDADALFPALKRVFYVLLEVIIELLDRHVAGLVGCVVVQCCFVEEWLSFRITRLQVNSQNPSSPHHTANSTPPALLPSPHNSPTSIKSYSDTSPTYGHSTSSGNASRSRG